MRFRIADIPIETSGTYPDGVLRSMASYVDDSSTDGAHIHISCEKAEALPVTEFEEHYGTKFMIQEFGIANGRYISQDRNGEKSIATLSFSPDFHNVDCALVDIEAKGGYNLKSRTQIALYTCMVHCLPAFGGMTYHASAIRYHDSAILFAGPCGSGKSTQSQLWKTYYPSSVTYINDDSPIIREHDGRLWAYGSPWAGTSGINNNIAAPIRAIVYIEQAEENSMRELIPREKAIKALCSVRSQGFPVQREKQARLVFRLIDEIPMFLLRCTISEQAVDLVKSRLYH